MGENSKIAWTHHTFNPWWGCAKVSEACRFCYAETFAKRTGNQVWGKHARRRFLSQANWEKPFKWNEAAEKAGERHRVFCSSMADVFERLPDGHPDEENMLAERLRLKHLIHETPHLDWLLLTKRPENAGLLGYDVNGWPDNVWLGTTAEAQDLYMDRGLKLLSHLANVHFVSVEPLLEPISVQPIANCIWGVEWVIIGCESRGPNVGRLSYMTGVNEELWLCWAQSIVNECRNFGMSCFVKQIPRGGRVVHDIAEFPKGLQVREFPSLQPAGALTSSHQEA